MQGGNNNASLQDSFEHQITSLDISLPFHFLHIDFCALRGNYTNFQTYLLSPQMHTKGYSTSLHIPLVNYLSMPKASVPDLNAPFQLPILVLSAKVLAWGCAAWTHLLPRHGLFYFCRITLCPFREKVLCLWTEANLPSCARELTPGISSGSLFGWWAILSCPFNLLSHLPLLHSPSVYWSPFFFLWGDKKIKEGISHLSPLLISFLSLASSSYK